MAGDWIPMRLDLAEDPAVMAMADELGCDEEFVVGCLHKVWSWASRQCHDGSVTNVTLLSLGRVTRRGEFLDAMRSAGWIREVRDENGAPRIEFPKWESWLGESAKKRLKDKERQRKKRESTPGGFPQKVSRSQRDKSVTTGQDRRGQKSNTHTHTAAGEAWSDQWDLWVDSWEGRCGKRFDPIQAEMQLQQLGRLSPEKAKRDLQFSLEKYSKTILDSDNDFQKRNSGGNQKRSKLNL